MFFNSFITEEAWKASPELNALRRANWHNSRRTPRTSARRTASWPRPSYHRVDHVSFVDLDGMPRIYLPDLCPAMDGEQVTPAPGMNVFGHSPPDVSPAKDANASFPSVLLRLILGLVWTPRAFTSQLLGVSRGPSTAQRHTIQVA